MWQLSRLSSLVIHYTYVYIYMISGFSYDRILGFTCAGLPKSSSEVPGGIYYIKWKFIKTIIYLFNTCHR